MSAIAEFKKQAKALLKDIEQYKKDSQKVNPYTVLSLLADVLGTAGVLVAPLKIPAIILKTSSKVLGAYVKHKTKNSN